MNRLNSQLCSMTRGRAIHEPLPTFLYPLSCQAVIDSVSSLIPKAKGSFQITRVVRKCSEHGDGLSADGISGDSASHSCDKLAVTVGGTCPMSAQKANDVSLPDGTCLPLSTILKQDIKQKVSDVQSRFRIVKIESKGHFKRGRWTCRDFVDPPEVKSTSKTATGAAGGIDAAASKPLFYMPGTGCDPTASQFIVYSEGHPVLESNALPTASELFTDVNSIAKPVLLSDSVLPPNAALSCSPSSHTHGASIGTSNPSREGAGKTSDIGSSVTESDNGPEASTERRHSDFDAVLWGHQLEQNRKSLLSLISSDRIVNNTESSAAALFEIDNKIEQAMDLVKTHLMFAVRLEVEELKEQIKELMVKNSQLEYENGILRASASPELLASLDSTAASDSA